MPFTLSLTATSDDVTRRLNVLFCLTFRCQLLSKCSVSNAGSFYFVQCFSIGLQPFQSQLSRDCDLVIPFRCTLSLHPRFCLRSLSSCLRLHPHLPVIIPPSFYLFFSNLFQKAVPTQDVTIALTFLLFIVCRIFLSSLTFASGKQYNLYYFNYQPTNALT